MSEPRILAFAGSARRDSFNKKTVRIAAAGATKAGAEVTFADLREFPMPIMDEDLEAEGGMPPHARRFRDLMIANDGFLVSSPENNSTISALLKNVIDWASRDQPDDEKPVPAFEGKVVGLMSASPGSLAGLRGLIHVRAIFGHMGCLVMPKQVGISQAHLAFADDGSLKDEKRQAQVEKIGADLVALLRKLRSG